MLAGIGEADDSPSLSATSQGWVAPVRSIRAASSAAVGGSASNEVAEASTCGA